MKSIFPLAVLFLILSSAAGGAGSPEEEAATIRGVRVAGAINPVVADFITGELEKSNAAGNRAFLIELDTPGGLDTAMRKIIQGILSSRIPVIVYVAPPGARAASAGAMITLAADFAAMAPGTNIGAAHPVAVGGGEQDKTMTAKVVNDAVAYARSLADRRGRNPEWAERIVRESISTPASEALAIGVIDLTAENTSDLLKKLDGRHYRRGEKSFVFNSAGTTVEFVDMGWRQRILDTISNPNVAYMLMMLGILGIFFEISQPGVILPGAIGGIALLLALFAFQTLPINYVGVLLILLGVILFLLEIKVTSYGMLAVGGIVSLSLGSLMLVDSSRPYLQISRGVIAGTVAVLSGFMTLVVALVIRTHRRTFTSGVEGMAGEIGEAVTPIDAGGEGRVFVHGEYWSAVSREPIRQGERIMIVRVAENMVLEVRKGDRPSGPEAIPPSGGF